MNLEASFPTKDALSIFPGLKRNATPTPIAKAKVVTISKYTKDFNPILPTFFRFPIDPIPKTIVRNIIGAINNFIMLIKDLPIISILTPCSGKKCPSNIPETIARIT